MQNEVEVIEKKEKKPLSKKRIVAIVALSLVAVLVLVPIVNQCVIVLFDEEGYEENGIRLTTDMYAKNAYAEDGVVYYTLVNDTIREFIPTGVSVLKETVVEKYVDGEWIKCETSEHPPLGYKLNPYDRNPLITVPAFGELDRTFDYEFWTFDLQEGDYRLWTAAYSRNSAITRFMDKFTPIPIAQEKSYRIPVYFSIPAAS